MDVLLELAGDSIMGMGGGGLEGCSCRTALSCQCSAAGEEGNPGQARLQGCVYLSLGMGQPRRVPGKPSWRGRSGNWGCQGSSHTCSHIPALPCSIKAGGRMQLLGSVSAPACFPATACRQGSSHGLSQAGGGQCCHGIVHVHSPGIVPCSNSCSIQEAALIGDGEPVGQDQDASQAGGYPCAGAQVGTGRPLEEMPFTTP